MTQIFNLARRYGIVAWRRRWLALALAWMVCLAGWIAVTLIPDQYKSSARIYVDTGAVLRPLLKGLAVDSTASSDVDILQHTLLSRPNLETLISRTDLELRARTYQQRERLIQKLGLQIHIQPQLSNLFTIDYTDRSPALARDVVQTIVTIFMERATGTSRDDLQSAQSFLDGQISSYESKLRQAEQARAAFQSKYADVLPASAGGASKLDAARSQLQLLRGEVIDTAARCELLRKEMLTTPPSLSSDRVASTTGARSGPDELGEARRRLAELRLHFTDKYPEIVAQESLVDSLAANHGGAPAADGSVSYRTLVPNPVYEQLKIRLVDAESLLASLQRQAQDSKQEVERLALVVRGAPEVQADYVNINRDYDMLRKNYDELILRRESMRIGAAADAQADEVKLRIVDAPQVPALPIGPKRTLLTIGVMLAGIGSAVALVALYVQLDASFFSTIELRDLGVPVLGGISLRERRRRKRRRGDLLGLAAGLSLLLIVFAGFVTYPMWLARIV